jgi:hypothetical protein
MEIFCQFTACFTLVPGVDRIGLVAFGMCFDLGLMVGSHLGASCNPIYFWRLRTLLLD